MFTQQAISQLVKALNEICSQSLLCIPKDSWITVRATTPHFIRRVGSLKGTRHAWCFHDPHCQNAIHFLRKNNVKCILIFYKTVRPRCFVIVSHSC